MSSIYNSYVISSTALKVLLLGVICILWWQDVKLKPHWHARQLTLQTQLHRRRRWAVSPIMDTMQTFTFWLNQCWNSNQNSNLLLPWKKPVRMVDRKHIRLHHVTWRSLWRSLWHGNGKWWQHIKRAFPSMFHRIIQLSIVLIYYGIMISYASYYNPLNVLCKRHPMDFVGLLCPHCYISINTSLVCSHKSERPSENQTLA